MKIIVMGGAGDIGSMVVEDLAGTDGVELITICDKNRESAEALAAKLSDSRAKVDVKQADAYIHTELVEAMRGYDVAASALGPFYLFETKLVRAAIEAGVDYCSVCDDWNAAEDVLNEFDDNAREKDRIILTGLGVSPGFSNVCVRYLAERMDSVRKADIFVYQPLNAGGGEAVIRHMMFIMNGKIAAWRNGERKLEAACAESRRVKFPKFGRIKVWNMGHAEPVTMPRFIEGIEEVNFMMGYGFGAELFVLAAKLGLYGSEKNKDRGVKLLGPLDKMLTGGGPGEGALRVDVWGMKKGREEHLVLCGTGMMREVTGLSLSVGAQMLAEKQLLVRHGGVYAPEACINPDDFLRRMREKGITAYEDVDMTRRV